MVRQSAVNVSNLTANWSSKSSDIDELYLEQHYWLAVITCFVIGSAAVIGTFGNCLVNIFRENVTNLCILYIYLLQIIWAVRLVSRDGISFKFVTRKLSEDFFQKAKRLYT